MGVFSSVILLLHLALLQQLSSSEPAIGQPPSLNPPDACSEFSGGAPLGTVWTLEDCVDVWTDFEESVPSWLHSRLPDKDVWGDTGTEMRRAGSPCIVEATFAPDGAGSTTIRHFATWLFSRELDCDWMTPRWSSTNIHQGNTTATMYCHRTGTLAELELAKTDPKKMAALRATNRCSVVNWLSYFQFAVPSVTVSETASLKIIEVRSCVN